MFCDGTISASDRPESIFSRHFFATFYDSKLGVFQSIDDHFDINQSHNTQHANFYCSFFQLLVAWVDAWARAMLWFPRIFNVSKSLLCKSQTWIFEFWKVNDEFSTRADPLSIFWYISTQHWNAFFSNISQEFFISEIDFLSSKISSSLMDNWILIWWRKNWFESSASDPSAAAEGKLLRMMECFSVRV